MVGSGAAVATPGAAEGPPARRARVELPTATGEILAGWAPAPVWGYRVDRLAPRTRALRHKAWDFYGIATAELYVAVAVAHVGYLGTAFVQVVDLATGARIDRIAVTPFGRGGALPASSARGDVVFRHRDARLAFSHVPGGRAIAIDWPGRRAIRAELVLEDRAGIAVVIPNGRGYYYNHKVPALPVRGWLRAGGTRHDLTGAFATLDWGRGVWPHATFWQWATASGRLADGRVLGVNLGAGFGDARAGDENMVTLDGVLHKLGPVDFAYQPRAWRAPWRLRDRAGRVDLILEPRLDNGAGAIVGPIGAELHQLIGRYRGTVVVAGERLAIDGLPGWAEQLRARW